MENYLTIPTPQGLMDAFVSAPGDVHQAPVMVVLQEAFGVNSYIKDICRRFSALGFFAVAPELYHRQGRHLQIPYNGRKLFQPLMAGLTNESILSDVRSVMEFLPSLPEVDHQRIYIVGFCLGGFASALCATEFTLKGAISFYGAGMVRPREGLNLTPFTEKLTQITCPSLFFFGGQDASIPPTDIIELRKFLEHQECIIKIFPQSDHGFFCHERKSYDPKASAEAWKIIKDWLRIEDRWTDRQNNLSV